MGKKMIPPLCRVFLESSGQGVFHLCFIIPSANLYPSLSFLSYNMGETIVSTWWGY